MTAKTFINLGRSLLPNRAVPLPILAGPFRGATICMNPRCSLRKVFGLYEHELNRWLDRVLPRVDTIVDVGANDGYFTFGCAAALQRSNKSARIIAFEPVDRHFQELQSSLTRHFYDDIQFEFHNYFVGADRIELDKVTNLNSIVDREVSPYTPENALVKIDIEGAELEAIAGASHWLNPQNYFLIEVHERSFIDILTREFDRHGIELEKIDQQPLPILGREHRSPLNWWLVSKLSGNEEARS